MSATSAWLIAHPGAEVHLDVARTHPHPAHRRRCSFPLEAFARHCLLQGVDELGYLLDRRAAIEAFEQRP